MKQRHAWRRCGAILCTLALATACGPPESVEIALHRETRTGADPAVAGASSAMRFGGEEPAPPAAAGALAWDVPAGWEELAPSGMRLANLRPAGNPEAECTIIELAGSGGTALGNVNRWRDQMGLGPITEAELNALPHVHLLGGDGRRVELTGSYSGMGDDPRGEWGLLAIYVPLPSSTVFVKMTGPAELVASETQAFDALCASLRFEAPVAAGGGAASAGGAGAAAGGMGYHVPEGWRDVGADGMRIVNLVAGSETQCYVIKLVGTAGDWLGNVNRWRNEFGQPPIDKGVLEAMPKVTLLGEPCPLLELEGEYAGMGADAGAGKGMLGTLLIRSTESVFVKMVGPADEVHSHRDGFVALVESLTEEG